MSSQRHFVWAFVIVTIVTAIASRVRRLALCISTGRHLRFVNYLFRGLKFSATPLMQ